MSDLVVGLVLGSPQVEEQLARLATAGVAFIVVGYSRTVGIAGQATLDCVVGGSVGRKFRLELEAHGGGGVGGDEYVVRQGVNIRSTQFVTCPPIEGRGCGHDGSWKENGDSGEELHYGW